MLVELPTGGRRERKWIGVDSTIVGKGIGV